MTMHLGAQDCQEICLNLVDSATLTDMTPTPEVEGTIAREVERGCRCALASRSFSDSKDGQRYWKWAALVLSVVLSAGALARGFGAAFYVSRPEYTQQTQNDAVARENMRGTLERLDKTLNLQAEAFKSLAGEVATMKVDLAVIGKNR